MKKSERRDNKIPKQKPEQKGEKLREADNVTVKEDGLQSSQTAEKITQKVREIIQAQGAFYHPHNAYDLKGRLCRYADFLIDGYLPPPKIHEGEMKEDITTDIAFFKKKFPGWNFEDVRKVAQELPLRLNQPEITIGNFGELYSILFRPRPGEIIDPQQRVTEFAAVLFKDRKELNLSDISRAAMVLKQAQDTGGSPSTDQVEKVYNALTSRLKKTEDE